MNFCYQKLDNLHFTKDTGYIQLINLMLLDLKKTEN